MIHKAHPFATPRHTIVLYSSLISLLKILAALAVVGYIASLRRPLLHLHHRQSQSETKHDPEKGFQPISQRRADWRSDNVPADCETIIKKPLPFEKRCKRPHAGEKDVFRCLDGRTLMFSQFRQDYYLYRYHFSKLNRTGNYVDVGANEPIGLSNTFFFDRCLHWSGICVEANPRYFEKLSRLRSCRLVPTCIGDRDGESDNFILRGGSSGLVTTNKGLRNWIAKNETLRAIRLRCTTLEKEFLRSNAIVIDYMSLDVEGHELNVLRGIDWDAVRINVISIKVKKESIGIIREFMKFIGYKELQRFPDGVKVQVALGGDLLFLHPTVVFGHPV